MFCQPYIISPLIYISSNSYYNISRPIELCNIVTMNFLLALSFYPKLVYWWDQYYLDGTFRGSHAKYLLVKLICDMWGDSLNIWHFTLPSINAVFLVINWRAGHKLVNHDCRHRTFKLQEWPPFLSSSKLISDLMMLKIGFIGYYWYKYCHCLHILSGFEAHGEVEK